MKVLVGMFNKQKELRGPSFAAHLITDSTLTLSTKQRPIIEWAGKSARQLSIRVILSDEVNTLCNANMIPIKSTLRRQAPHILKTSR